MARTSGHGNPSWTRDETILALDLYFDCDGKIPSGRDPRVVALSELLRQLPYHSEASKRDSFRNGDGVAFKLQNLRQVATGHGLGNVSQMDRKIWSELGSRPEAVKQIAEVIRGNIAAAQAMPSQETEEDEEFFEGRVATIVHKRRERNSRLRSQLIELRRNGNGLACDVCGTVGPTTSEALAEAIFEAHHIIPLAASAERKTRLTDMALLCATCHRLIHRLITVEKRWITPSEAKVLLGFALERDEGHSQPSSR